jgi:hypothetical protein
MTHAPRRFLITVAILTLVALPGCIARHVYTTDCGFDKFPAHITKSRVTWTPTAAGGHLEGRVRELGGKKAPITKAAILLAERGSYDTLRIRVDSTGAFRRDSLLPGRRKVVVEARWYWAAFDSIDVRADSGLHAEVQLEPTPQGWYGCIPH